MSLGVPLWMLMLKVFYLKKVEGNFNGCWNQFTRFISSIFCPAGVMYSIVVYLYNLIRAAIGQISLCCCPESSIAMSLPRDNWEALQYKQRRNAAYLRTGLLIQGLFCQKDSLQKIPSFL